MSVLTVASIAPRDGRACAHCGATEGLSIQHRANKGMGGSKVLERKSNGIILDAIYNSALEQHADLAEHARRMGWKISRYDNPAEVPYWHHPTQQWWMADDGGTRRPATLAEVEAHVERYAPS